MSIWQLLSMNSDLIYGVAITTSYSNNIAAIEDRTFQNYQITFKNNGSPETVLYRLNEIVKYIDELDLIKGCIDKYYNLGLSILEKGFTYEKYLIERKLLRIKLRSNEISKIEYDSNLKSNKQLYISTAEEIKLLIKVFLTYFLQN